MAYPSLCGSTVMVISVVLSTRPLPSHTGHLLVVNSASTVPEPKQLRQISIFEHL
jgi:hypothetical protein